MTNNETVWTDWLKNPGTGECPVPEWAEACEVRLDHGDQVKGDAEQWNWFSGDSSILAISHYRYSIPADLAWLAENLDWSGILGLPYIYRDGNGHGRFSISRSDGRYTKSQWLRTRQDLGLVHPVTEEEEEAWRERVEAQEADRMNVIARNGNDGDHYAEVSDGSTASYYELPEGATELQHLISHRNLNAQDGEIFRAIYRKGLCPHSSLLREAKKVLFYAQAEVERLEAKERGQ